ncbi:MAG: hypothetical protein IJU37_08850 [Desulfovibrio sp.]|nr:hypothetical protein [Desulfovibrio sp.]
MFQFSAWEKLYLILMVPAAFGSIIQFFLVGADTASVDILSAQDGVPDSCVASSLDNASAAVHANQRVQPVPAQGTNMPVSDSVAAHDHSGLHISLGGICNFLLGAGLSGYLSARWGLLSLVVAALGGAFFVWLLATFLTFLTRASLQEEKGAQVPSAHSGMECVTTSTLEPGIVGSVDVCIEGRHCGYFATASERIPVGTCCIVLTVDGNTVSVALRQSSSPEQENSNHGMV